MMPPLPPPGLVPLPTPGLKIRLGSEDNLDDIIKMNEEADHLTESGVADISIAPSIPETILTGLFVNIEAT